MYDFLFVKHFEKYFLSTIKIKVDDLAFVFGVCVGADIIRQLWFSVAKC